MKTILYSKPDGVIAIVRPLEGARLALSITLASGEKLTSVSARPVDTFARVWPVAGAIAEWAESEDEFVERIKQKDVPPGATNVRIIEGSEIPTERKYRNAWMQDSAGKVYVDPALARKIDNDEIKAQLDALDASTKSTRGERELALAVSALPGVAVSAAVIQKAQETELKAATLRLQLKPE